jgi:hypothetical protein
VAERARRRAAAGELALAIQLAEVALSAEPAHRGALEASLAAHRGLLGRSANFWETSWLRRRVGELEAALGGGA